MAETPFDKSAWLAPVLKALPSSPDNRLVFAETGYASTNTTVNLAPKGEKAQCYDWIHSTVADATEYFAAVKEAAAANGGDLVIWWSNSDLLIHGFNERCPCDKVAHALWCEFEDVYASSYNKTVPWEGIALFKAFGNMGLREVRTGGAPGTRVPWSH